LRSWNAWSTPRPRAWTGAQIRDEVGFHLVIRRSLQDANQDRHFGSPTPPYRPDPTHLLQFSSLSSKGGSIPASAQSVHPKVPSSDRSSGPYPTRLVQLSSLSLSGIRPTVAYGLNPAYRVRPRHPPSRRSPGRYAATHAHFLAHGWGSELAIERDAAMLACDAPRGAIAIRLSERRARLLRVGSLPSLGARLFKQPREDLPESLDDFNLLDLRLRESERERVLLVFRLEAIRELARSRFSLSCVALVVAHFVTRQSPARDPFDQSEHVFDRVLAHDLQKC